MPDQNVRSRRKSQSFRSGIKTDSIENTEEYEIVPNDSVSSMFAEEEDTLYDSEPYEDSKTVSETRVLPTLVSASLVSDESDIDRELLERDSIFTEEEVRSLREARARQIKSNNTKRIAGTSGRNSTSRRNVPQKRTAPERTYSGSGNSKKKKKKKSKYIPDTRTTAHKVIVAIIIVLIIGIVASACLIGYNFAKKLTYDVAVDPTNKNYVKITLDGTESNEEVGKMLLDNGLIDDVDWFTYRCILYSARFLKGTYKLSPSYSQEKMIDIMSGYKYSDGKMQEPDEETEKETEKETTSAEENTENAEEGE